MGDLLGDQKENIDPATGEMACIWPAAASAKKQHAAPRQPLRARENRMASVSSCFLRLVAPGNEPDACYPAGFFLRFPHEDAAMSDEDSLLPQSIVLQTHARVLLFFFLSPLLSSLLSLNPPSPPTVCVLQPPFRCCVYANPLSPLPLVRFSSQRYPQRCKAKHVMIFFCITNLARLVNG